MRPVVGVNEDPGINKEGHFRRHMPDHSATARREFLHHIIRRREHRFNKGSHRDFHAVPIGVEHDAFIVSIAGAAWPVDNPIAVRLQPGSQGINLLF